MGNPFIATIHDKSGWVHSSDKSPMLKPLIDPLQPLVLQFIGQTQSLIPNA